MNRATADALIGPCDFFIRAADEEVANLDENETKLLELFKNVRDALAADETVM